MDSYKITFLSLFLFLLFIFIVLITACESPTSPHRTKQQIEIRNDNGGRN